MKEHKVCEWDCEFVSTVNKSKSALAAQSLFSHQTKTKTILIFHD